MIQKPSKTAVNRPGTPAVVPETTIVPRETVTVSGVTTTVLGHTPNVSSATPTVPAASTDIVARHAWYTARMPWIRNAHFRKHLVGLCPHCRYDLTGLAADTPCPECGHTPETPRSAAT